MAEPDLLPCPFCGGGFENQGAYNDGRLYAEHVSRHNCVLGGKRLMGADEFAAWNRRASTPAPDHTNAEVSDERLREAPPCPFCGVVPEIVKDRYGYKVECHNVDCGAMPAAAAASESEAVDAWNRRSVTSQASEKMSKDE